MRKHLSKALALALAMSSLASVSLAEGSVLNVWCWNDEFQSRFNAYYPEPCLMEYLGARLPETRPEPRSLYLLSAHLKARHDISGTYKYAGEWNQLDNFIVSGSLLSHSTPSTFSTNADCCRIADFDFLLTGLNTEAGPRPFRSFLGTYYQKGFSDHLPLVLDLYW